VWCDARKRWSLLWRKTLIFCDGDVDCMIHKDLPQGTVLSPFMYYLLGSGMESFVPSGCNFLQYAGVIVVHSSYHVLHTTCALVQMACLSLSGDSLVLFPQKHLQPPVWIRISSRFLSQSVSFKYLGTSFDAGLRWETQARYVHKS
jgi:hypothetical protein